MLRTSLMRIKDLKPFRGVSSQFVKGETSSSTYSKWFDDQKIGLMCQALIWGRF